MLTQDPTLRATKLLAGATKPVRIFIGYSARNGKGERLLIASLTKLDINKTLPSSEMTVEPDTAVADLSAAIQSAWAALPVKSATTPSTPRPGHLWRAPNFARRNPC